MEGGEFCPEIIIGSIRIILYHLLLKSMDIDLGKLGRLDAYYGLCG